MKLFGIDPASKKWNFVEANWTGNGTFSFVTQDNSIYQQVSYDELPALASRLMREKSIAVLDAPIVYPKQDHWLFSYASRPTKSCFPFDCPPLSQRPVERLLVAKMGGKVTDNAGPELAKAMEGIVGPDKSFQTRHAGLSVKAYCEVTHWTSVQFFLNIFEARKKSYNTNPLVGGRRINIFESHPALNLAMWREPSHTLAKYKGTSKVTQKGKKKRVKNFKPNGNMVKDALSEIAKIFGCAVPDKPKDDNELDALISLAAAVEVAKGKADWIGDHEDGYIMLPGPRANVNWRDTYEQSKSKVLEHLNQSAKK